MEAMFGIGGAGQDLTITLKDGIVTLEGCLAGGSNIIYCVKNALRYAARFSDIPVLTINATACKIVPGGEQVWIAGVDQWLSSRNLHYADSQLALILQCDYGYKHQRSTYEVPV